MGTNINKSTDIVTDPVCGMKKPKSEMKTQSEYLGKTYYFCSESDRDIFVAHPDYWIPKVEK